jgi:hypothetical protein
MRREGRLLMGLCVGRRGDLSEDMCVNTRSDEEEEEEGKEIARSYRLESVVYKVCSTIYHRPQPWPSQL